MALTKYPATSRPEDIAAARAATFGVSDRTARNNSWWIDPVLLGRYPEDGLRLYADELPEWQPGDLALISEPVDFCGMNIYQGTPVRAGLAGAEVVPHPPGAPLTAYDWWVTPAAAYWGPRLFWERYGCPIVITENGVSCRDWIARDGRVHDPDRIDFTTRYLLELRRAIGDGVPVTGYFHWSWIDNFEWSHGYQQRFGLVFCDHATGARVPKDSADWYARVIASNGGCLGGE